MRPAKKPAATPTGEPVALLHIYPIETDGVHIVGIRAAEQDVTEDEWLRLNAYRPPAFAYDPLPPEDMTPKEGE